MAATDKTTEIVIQEMHAATIVSKIHLPHGLKNGCLSFGEDGTTLLVLV
jgi:hypothetical protein